MFGLASTTSILPAPDQPMATDPRLVWIVTEAWWRLFGGKVCSTDFARAPGVHHPLIVVSALDTITLNRAAAADVRGARTALVALCTVAGGPDRVWPRHAFEDGREMVDLEALPRADLADTELRLWAYKRLAHACALRYPDASVVLVYTSDAVDNQLKQVWKALGAAAICRGRLFSGWTAANTKELIAVAAPSTAPAPPPAPSPAGPAPLAPATHALANRPPMPMPMPMPMPIAIVIDTNCIRLVQRASGMESTLQVLLDAADILAARPRRAGDVSALVLPQQVLDEKLAPPRPGTTRIPQQQQALDDQDTLILRLPYTHPTIFIPDRSMPHRPIRQLKLPRRCELDPDARIRYEQLLCERQHRYQGLMVSGDAGMVVATWHGGRAAVYATGPMAMPDASAEAAVQFMDTVAVLSLAESSSTVWP
ncbi:hypothetical protein CspHIS471_0314030 [Cutaneotrichosporon sp. HIS471]|nr:hypothetical protein CspHIS471_0314030 [Cutaneotrichosporon sp. HIS471]